MTDSLMSPEQLTEIIRLHKAWLNGEHDGVRADLREANLSAANLSGADLSRADLSEANLRVANLRGADLRGANLSGTDLSVANLCEADLSGANLCGADLSGADLSGADLSGANLREADLSGAILRVADLSEANLRGANLSGADLSGAGLREAILRVTDLGGAIGLPFQHDAPQRLQAVAKQVLAEPKRLQMDSWHSDCGTAHCLAGWAIYQAGDLGRQLEADYGSDIAGLFLLGADATQHFYDSNDKALKWLRSVVEVG